MDIKFTKDGKKVAVLGKLNNEEWIVQEIFVADGKEFPAGENFTTKTLLDKPAETYDERRKKELEQRAKRMESQIDELEKKTRIARRKENAARLLNYATEKYADIDLEQLDTLLAFMAGEITHIITCHYHDYQILSLIDAVEGTYSCGLRLVSLFGCREDGSRGNKDRSFHLDWAINQYRDASGSWYEIYPCCSYKDAVARLDVLISQREKATESLIEAKQKYDLQHPTEEKIAAYYQAIVVSKNNSVKAAEDKLNKAKAELEIAQQNSAGNLRQD